MWKLREFQQVSRCHLLSLNSSLHVYLWEKCQTDLAETLHTYPYPLALGPKGKLRFSENVNLRAYYKRFYTNSVT